MKQIEYFKPKKVYIDNTIKEILSRYKGGTKNRIMYDLINNLIGDEYNYLQTRISIKKGEIDEKLAKKFYNFGEYDKKLNIIIRVYEEIRDNEKMVQMILDKANGEVSIIEKNDIINFYKKIQNETHHGKNF